MQRARCIAWSVKSIRKARNLRITGASMASIVADLREKTAAAARGGPARAIDKHRARGRLLVRERIDLLLDPGTPFLELSALAAHGLYGDEIPGAGIVTGIGRVSGRECVIVGERSDGQGRHLLPADREEAFARAGNRAREPAAVPLPASRAAARSCRHRTKCFRTGTISAAYFSIRRTCRRPASRRSRSCTVRAPPAAPMCPRCPMRT